MAVVVQGTVGIDTVITPYGEARDVLGGSAAYFGLAASLFTTVAIVAAVGDDFPPAFREALLSPRIDLGGLETRAGAKTFRWVGEYENDLNRRRTLETQLNVVADAPPRVPEAFRDSRVLYLANGPPRQQRATLSMMRSPKLVACDTMDLWIRTTLPELQELLAKVDGVILNDTEARELTGGYDIVTAGETIRAMGPRFVVIKKGEHGALLFTAEGVTAVPGFPHRHVVDPTGAGDSFAGGMLGYLDAVDRYDTRSLREGLIRGTVAASFTIEGFSIERLREVSPADVQARTAEFLRMLRLE